jgi:MFS family permease
MLVLSGVFCSLGFVVWLLSSSFWLFLLGFFFLTVCGTFRSGTLQAYVYDFLRLNGKQEEFERIWGRGIALELVGIAVAMSLGGFLSTYSYELVVVVSALSPLVVVSVALLLPRVRPARAARRRNYFSLIRRGVRQTFAHPVILRAMLYSAVVVMVPGVLEEYHQVLLSSWLDLPNSLIGIWLGWRVLNGAAVLAGVILVAVPFCKSFWLLGLVLLFSAMQGLQGVLIQGVIQREIDTDERATISSVNAGSMEVGGILLGLSFAFVADALGIQVGYGFCGLVIMGYLLLRLTLTRVPMGRRKIRT